MSHDSCHTHVVTKLTLSGEVEVKWLGVEVTTVPKSLVTNADPPVFGDKSNGHQYLKD